MISLVSFGYKYKDNPKSSWNPKVLVFDIRKTVRNPWNEKDLKKLTGLDPKVQEWIFRCKRSVLLTKDIATSVVAWSYKCPTIFIGCHGGKHRSVAVVERVAEMLRLAGHEVSVTHRDLLK